MINKLLKWFGYQKEEKITYTLDVPPWIETDAIELNAFLQGKGVLFVKHMQRYQHEVNQWATDVSMESYDNMKYRACVAHGVKLAFDKMIGMSRVKPELKHHKEPDEKQMDKFFSKRMSMFKS